MKLKFITFAIILLIPATSFAGYVGNVLPSNMFGAKTIKFGVNNPPSDTCNYYNRHFAFDATTDEGKNILSILLAVMMSGRVVDVWYTASTAPGSNQNSGCKESTMAVVTSIGIN